MNNRSLLPLLLLIILPFLPACRHATSPMADEFQVGIWLNRHIMAEGPEAITAFLDDAQSRGVTDIYPNFWFHGYVIYPGSRWVEQHPEFRGWDPMATVMVEATRRGLRVHPWGEYGFFSYFNRANDPEDIGAILQENPEWMVEDREGRHFVHNERYNVTHFSMNPGHPEARRFLREVMLESLRLYPQAAGLNLDRIRYQSREFSYDRYSRERFAAAHGFDPLLTGMSPAQQLVWERWRIDQVNAFTRETARAMRREFRGKTLSAAVLPPYMMDDKFQRWNEWVEAGHLDLAMPMIYGHLEMVLREIDLALTLVPPRQLVVGLDVGAMSAEDIRQATAHARSAGAAGVVLWDDSAFRRKSDVRF